MAKLWKRRVENSGQKEKGEGRRSKEEERERRKNDQGGPDQDLAISGRRTHYG